jgi:MoxR-like ATPase
MTLLQLLKQQGKALVIKGAQGSGKTLLATQLAKAEGVYSNDHIEQVFGKNTFNHWLNELPDVVIVEGAPKPKHIDVIKSMIANDKITHNRKGKEPVEVKTPMFVFCTSDPELLNFGAQDRRFYVLELDA